MQILFVLELMALISSVFAHPGHNVEDEAAERASFLQLKPRTVRDCSAVLKKRGYATAAVRRRHKFATSLRLKRGLTKTPTLLPRDLASYNFSHHSTDADINYNVDETYLFADNSSCTLQSEVTQGPYYVTGELIRKNVTEDQLGVPVYLDIQVIDTATCEPASAVYMDLWHCNATGVYSGVNATGNGNTADDSNIDATFLRGIQQTDLNGIVQFETLFPGHYDGRTNHIHILTHAGNSTTVRVNGTLLSDKYNGTLTHASHVGQLFFDQSLISQVEATAPYSTNTQSVTTNDEDSILSAEADTTDPFVEYVLLGDSVADGILAWISVGIDLTSDQEITSAATKYASGGVSNEQSLGAGAGGVGGNGTMGGNGTAGSMPSQSQS